VSQRNLRRINFWRRKNLCGQDAVSPELVFNETKLPDDGMRESLYPIFTSQEDIVQTSFR
jgi:hypothetical protein